MYEATVQAISVMVFARIVILYTSYYSMYNRAQQNDSSHIKNEHYPRHYIY